MSVITCVAIGLIYALTRFLASAKIGEAASSGVLLAIFCLVISYKNRIFHLREVMYAFAPSLRPWLSLIIASGIVTMGVIRHDVPVEIAVLDGFFAFVFFTAFASMFSRKRIAPSDPSK